MDIRTLRADEIECRVSTISKNAKGVGCSLLLYKDARCDMRILDEVYGSLNWQRSHQLIGDRLYCTVSVRNPETGEWISKQDVGTESYTEKEKGQASDAYKRACFNIGIGRELYSAPFIWINLREGEFYEKNGKLQVKANFHVKEIEYDEFRNICTLVIADKNGEPRFKLWEKPMKKSDFEPKPEPKPEPELFCDFCGEKLEDAVSKRGKLYTVSAIADGSMKKYGKIVCWNCMQAQKAVENAHG